jgi:predicted nucleic acid-binding protein
MNAVDTNVFVCALDDTEPAKQTKAQELIAQLVQAPVETVLLWQVAGEFPTAGDWL